MDDLHQRAARADDAPCLAALATQVFLDTYATRGIRPPLAREVLAGCGVDAFAELLRASQTRIELAELDGHLVAFSQLAFGATHELARCAAPAELVRLYVQGPFVRRGIGRRLLAAAERAAADAGADVLWLTAWSPNARARAFYEQHGYADRGLTWFRFEGESHENRLLSKALAR